MAVFYPRITTSQFDAIVNNWGLDPAPSNVRDHWHTMPDNNRALNFQLYSNPVVDAALDSAAVEWDQARSRALYRKAYQSITDDVPAVWLYENRPFMAIHNRVQPNLTARDAWWRTLRLWSIPREKRLPRDK
jgi:peptide/nickel transport system substrate-binding protein